MFPLQNPSQNLIRQVPAERIIRPAGFYTSIALDALAVLAAVLTGYFYRGYLDGTLGLQYALAGAAFMGVLSVLGALFTRPFGRRAGVLVLTAAGFVAFFYDFPFKLALAAGGATLVFLFWGELAARRELANSLEIQFMRTARLFVNKLVTGLLIAGLLLYLPLWESGRDLIPQQTFQNLFDWSAGVASKLYPEIRFNSSIDTFAKSIARSQLQANTEFRNLLPPAQEKAISEVATQVLGNFMQMIGIGASPEDTLNAVLYDFSVRTLEGWRAGLGNSFVFIWAAAIFFALRGIGIFFSFILCGISLFVYQTMLAMKVIHISGESRMHELIEYS